MFILFFSLARFCLSLSLLKKKKTIYFGCAGYFLQLQWLPSLHTQHGLSCPEACGILVPWPGIKPAPPVLESRFSTLDHQGSPWRSFSTTLIFLISSCFTFLQSRMIPAPWLSPQASLWFRGQPGEASVVGAGTGKPSLPSIPGITSLWIQILIGQASS